MSRLAGKVAIVTGGAGGIGAATAHELAREGAAVAVVDIDEAKAAEVADEIRRTGARAIALGGDLAEEDAAQVRRANPPWRSSAASMSCTTMRR